MRRFCARVGPTPDRARTEGVVAGSADGGSLRDKGLLVRFHAPRPGPWHIHSPSFWKAARAVELTCVPAFSMGTAELDLMPPSALVDYLMDLAPRIIEWRSTDCSTSHPQSKTSKRTCHPQFRNGVLEVVRDSKQVTINVRGIFAMRWSNHSEILLVSSE